MSNHTKDMLKDVSFEQIELSTMHTILDIECLQISSEVELFRALTRYGQANGFLRNIGESHSFIVLKIVFYHI